MIWLNERPMPRAYQAFAMSWKRHHPDWTLVLWQDHPHAYPHVFDETRMVDTLELRHPSLHDASESAATRSNVLRLEIVAQRGGVYVDTDFICHRAIDPVVGRAACFVAEQDDEFINNAIFGAVPGHAEIERALESMPAVRAATHHCPAIATGPHLFTEMFRGNPRVSVVPRGAFYPMSWRGTYAAPDRDSFATHLWAFTWKEELGHER